MSNTYDEAKRRTVQLLGPEPSGKEIPKSILIFVIALLAGSVVLIFVDPDNGFTLSGMIAVLVAGGYYLYRRHEWKQWNRELHRQIAMLDTQQ